MLYRTTAVIWTTYNPTGVTELSELAEQAETSDAYCSWQQTTAVPAAAAADDPHADEGLVDFFAIADDDQRLQ